MQQCPLLKVKVIKLKDKCYSRFILLGASGHAKVVASAIQAEGNKVMAFYDDDPLLLGKHIACSVVAGSLRDLKDEASIYGHIICIGANLTRKTVSHSFCELLWGCVIHPSSFVAPSVQLGEGVVVMAGAIVQPDVKLGNHCVINTHCSVDHDCYLADYSHISPGATLCGNVTVGECSYIGAGSVIKQGVNIGRNVMIGAGSVVISDIADNVIAYGNPAKIIKHGVFV